MKHRQDIRTDEEFARDIKKFTERERAGALILQKQLQKTGHRVIVLNYGDDNTGEIISGKITGKPDYKFIVDASEYLIEIKVHDEKYPHYTFKKSNIENYLSEGAYIAVLRNTYAVILPPAILLEIQENYEPKIYWGFSPNDLAYRISQKDMEKWVEDKKVVKIEWYPTILNLIPQILS